MTGRPPVRFLMQARVSSTRLPGKALLPVAGLPAVVLAARRAARAGADLVVATSAEASDDGLAQVLSAAGLRVHRGPLDDVLARFVGASADLPDEAVIVRLTADNLFPDAGFIEGIVAALIDSGLDYVGTSSPSDGLPYGLSAEAFRLSALREAAEQAVETLDRSDVTPWIVRNQPGRIYDDLAERVGQPHLRCTIDTIDDYQRVWRVFEGLADPVAAPHQALCARLAALPDAPRFRVPHKMVGEAPHGTLVLGTAQLGQDYGLANRSGCPAQEDAVAMLRRAIEHGVTHIDSAGFYGDAERRIGLALAQGWHSRASVVTKISVPKGLGGGEQRALVDAQVFGSCRALGLETLDTVLLHEAWPLSDPARPYLGRLIELRDEGVLRRVGLSVEQPQDLALALETEELEHLQIPCNLLDHRWAESGLLGRLAARGDLLVHGRSAFLQGLLVAEDEAPWRRIGAPLEIKAALQGLVDDLDRESLADLCLAFMRAQGWLDGIVVGAETPAQLEANLRLFTEPALTPDDCETVRRRLPRAPDWLLDPGQWRGPRAVAEI